VKLAKSDTDILFSQPPTMEILRSIMPAGIVVTEAKSLCMSLEDHIPQAAGGMYACAKSLGKDIIRGALTSGDVWIFLILIINGDGAKYWQSRGIEALSSKHPYGRVATPPWPDVIVGILAYWMDHSFETIRADDWFDVWPKVHEMQEVSTDQ